MHPRFFLAVLTLALAPAVLAGGDVYRWTDDQGRTQFGDTVPERYKRVARKLDTSSTVLADSDRSAADLRRQQLQDAAEATEPKPRVRETARRAPAPAEAEPAADPDGLGGGVFIIDALPKRAEPACRAKVRAYEESLRCFAPYRNANGTVHAEGLARCKNVPVPPPCR